MFGLGHLTRAQRLILGMFVLLLVDVIWVVSSEITKVPTLQVINCSCGLDLKNVK